MWKAHRGTLHRFTGTRPTGLQSRRCAMHSGTHTQVASESKSIIANGSVGCGSATMEKASTRRFSADTGRTGTTACLAMHERARAVGGTLAVWSELDSNTEAGL